MGWSSINFQNIPRGDATVKRAIISKRGALAFADYKQIEPRLLAYFASKIGDDSMAAQIRGGLDPYTVIVRGLYGEHITDVQRQRGKVLFLSLMYGGGIYTVQQQFGVERAEAKQMIRDFHKAWPLVRELQDRVLAAHQRRGFIRGLDGRHLHMEENGEHKLLNKLVQGSAAGVMKRALINIHRYLKANPQIETRMVSVVHDEVITDGPERELPFLANALPNLMRQGFEYVHEIVPIEVELEVSTTSWADKVEYAEWATTTEVAV